MTNLVQQGLFVMDYYFVSRQTDCDHALAYHCMNDQRRNPATETREQQSSIDEGPVDTEPLPVPVVVNVEQVTAEERIKQKQEAAKKERDELKETLKKIM